MTRESSGSRRTFLKGAGVATAAALAGCTGGEDGENGGENGGETGNGDGGEGRSFDVGYGEFATTVSESEFPDDDLYIYCVQTGWSNWDAVMEAFEDEYGLALHDDQRSSGEAVTHIQSNAQNPTHSAYNGGYSFGIDVMDDGFTQAYKPANWDTVPEELKTEDGHLTATRQMTTAITYRPDIYEERGIEPPETWEDLKQPEIAQDLAFTPPHTANGLASALSVNHAYGGDMDDLDPVIEYHEEIADHGADFRRNVEGDFTSGEISTVVEYDYTGLHWKYNVDSIAEEEVDVVIPTAPEGGEGAMNVPYGYALLEGAPNPGPAKLFMDFVLSLEAQEMFFDAFVRPIRADELDQPDEFPDASVYEEAEFAVDQLELVENQNAIMEELTDRSPLPGAQ